LHLPNVDLFALHSTSRVKVENENNNDKIEEENSNTNKPKILSPVTEEDGILKEGFL
jgi:hypothetical protein